MALAFHPVLGTCGSRTCPNRCRRVVDEKAELPQNRLMRPTYAPAGCWPGDRSRTWTPMGVLKRGVCLQSPHYTYTSS